MQDEYRTLPVDDYTETETLEQRVELLEETLTAVVQGVLVIRARLLELIPGDEDEDE